MMNGFKKFFLGVAGIVLAALMIPVHARETCIRDSITTPDLIICGQRSFEKLDAALNEQ